MNKFGLTEEEMKFILATVVIPLEKLGAKIYIFGSRARGDFQKFSDLDILIEEKEKVNPGLIGEINEVLENSNFPYKVDLVLLEEVAESYSDNIKKEKTLISGEE